jgi:hypothetical protein
VSKRKTSIPVYWGLVGSALLLLVVRLGLADNESVALRLVVVPAALLIPALLVFWQGRLKWREVVGSPPDPTLLALSALAGLAIWPLAWWLMSLVDDALVDAVGPFTPLPVFRPEQWDTQWTEYVLSEVALIPLATTLLLWGVVRSQLQAEHSLLTSSVALALCFGLLAVLMLGQGMVGALGYGLCGAGAAVASLRARSAWAGLATQATFMYANLSLLDNLLREVFGEPYLGRTWLSLVLVSGLALLAVLQVMRFRSLPLTPRARTRPVHQGLSLALVILTFAALLVTIDELDQRRSNDRQRETAATLPLQPPQDSHQQPH